MYNIKIENYLLFGRLSEDLSLGTQLSDTSEGLLGGGKEGDRILEVFATKTSLSEH